MTTMVQLPLETPAAPQRSVMNGKPVITVDAKSVINFGSAFGHKLLCDSLTFTTGSACAYSCSFCYVPDLMRKNPHRIDMSLRHESIVIRRANAVRIAHDQLSFADGRKRFDDPTDQRVIYASPLVDVAANMDLVRETIEVCRVILERTHWHIRLLSKSNLLPRIAEALADHRDRLIYGVSTGTLDDRLAQAFESGAPLVSKRLASLHWLQDNGFRTFGMICPSLPQADYERFAKAMHEAIRADRCEHVWGEVINVRGESMVRTLTALREAGYHAPAARLEHVSTDKAAWEEYARATFLSSAPLYRPGQYRFLQYVTASSRRWWEERVPQGAVLL